MSCGRKLGPFDCCSVVQGDCLELMRLLPDGCVDAVITDPPYGIGYKSNWKTALGNVPRSNAASFGDDRFNPQWCVEISRIANGFVYVFTRWDVMHEWRDAFCGLNVRGRLVWNKLHWKMGDLSVYGSQLEDVLLLSKGMPSIFDGGENRRGNLIDHSAFFLPEGQFDHPTQKPESVLMQFITDATRENAIVFDPFGGSGSTLVAAKKLGRHFLGFEISPDYCEIARKRIAAVEAQPTLFQPKPEQLALATTTNACGQGPGECSCEEPCTEEKRDA